VMLSLGNRLMFVSSWLVKHENWKPEGGKPYHTFRLTDTRWRPHWEDIAYASPGT
jgi:hypothetical protein